MAQLNIDVDPDTHRIVWTIDRLEPSWSGNINFKVMVPEPLAFRGLIFTNTAQITLPPGEVTVADNSATAVAFTGPDLSIGKSLTAGDLVPGGLVTFTIDVGNRNNGPWHRQPAGGSAVGAHHRHAARGDDLRVRH